MLGFLKAIFSNSISAVAIVRFFLGYESVKVSGSIAVTDVQFSGNTKPLSNFLSVFASNCADFCEALFLPIKFEADLDERTARIDIPGVLKSRARPKINEFNGEPFHIAIARSKGSFEFTYAVLGLGKTAVTGDMAMSYKDSCVHFCIHHFDQDGLVREQSRLTS